MCIYDIPPSFPFGKHKHFEEEDWRRRQWPPWRQDGDVKSIKRFAKIYSFRYRFICVILLFYFFRIIHYTLEIALQTSHIQSTLVQTHSHTHTHPYDAHNTYDTYNCTHSASGAPAKGPYARIRPYARCECRLCSRYKSQTHTHGEWQSRSILINRKMQRTAIHMIPVDDDVVVVVHQQQRRICPSFCKTQTDMIVIYLTLNRGNLLFIYFDVLRTGKI